jgi:hypothetical protein
MNDKRHDLARDGPSGEDRSQLSLAPKFLGRNNLLFHTFLLFHVDESNLLTKR